MSHFGSLRVDAAVEGEVLRALAPVGMTAALDAIEIHRRDGEERWRQGELALQAARYEAKRVRRQYDAVDPPTGWLPRIWSSAGTRAWPRSSGWKPS